MKPYYDHGGITIFHGDCRDILPQLEPESVSLLLTDPPYGLGQSELAWQEKGYRRISEDWDAEFPTEWAALASSALRSGGSLLCFMAWKTCHQVLSCLDQTGMTRRDVIVWDKVNTMPNVTARGYQFTHEFIAWYTKGGNYVWQTEKQVRDVLRFTWSQAQRWHPSQKTVPLIRDLIARHSKPDSLVLDPFMGSGTTLRAAKDLGRRCIGIEKEERYCAIAVQRLQQAVLPLEVAS